MRDRALVACLVLVATAMVGCGGGGRSSGAQERTVLVDYRHDETETSLFDYFPKKATVRPGDTLTFKQAWTGEPHSVTFGKLVDPKLRPIIDLVEKVERTGQFPGGDEPEEFRAFDLPFAFGESEDAGTAQNAAQPCYVADADVWPGGINTACPQREQPAFTGRDAIYSSGIIPYEGVGGNTFEVPIADDAELGTYSYFCNVHGPLQYGEVEIVAKAAEIPSAREVARTARAEAEEHAEVMVDNHKAATAGRAVVAGETGDERLETKGKRFIGVPSPFFYKGKLIHGVVNEFVPRDVRAKVGEKVTWTFVSGHTISFNVPKYFPVFTVATDGRVEYNPKASEPAAWPGPPRGEPPGEHGEGSDGRPAAVKVDAGEWDGKGFRSTGLDYSDGDEFSVTFTKAGTYPFACLIHPEMVGEIVVK